MVSLNLLWKLKVFGSERHCIELQQRVAVLRYWCCSFFFLVEGSIQNFNRVFYVFFSLKNFCYESSRWPSI
jgi:hypothetical protein